MKRICSFLILVLFCFCLIGCGEDETISNNSEIDKPINQENSELKSLVSVNDMGYIPGEYGLGLILMKVSNGNKKEVKVTINIEYYDKDNNKVDSDETYVRVGVNKAAYAMVRMFVEKVEYSTYKYTYSVIADEGYDKINSNVKVSYSNNNNKIGIKTTNNSSRVTTACVFVLFYNSGKIVDVKDYYEYDITSGSSKTGSVDYPIDKNGKKMSVDKVEVVLNQVTTDL